MTQYNVPTGEEEEEAIASRALHGNKDHKDFANRKELSMATPMSCADP